MRYIDPAERLNPALPAIVRRMRAMVQAGARLNRSKAAVERNSLYGTTAWRKLRAAFLAENRFCVLCGAPATQVDHLKHGERWREHFFDPSNLRALCQRCHASVSAKTRATKMRQGDYDHSHRTPRRD